MKKKGSVLIESLIAILIFLIGIVPLTKFTLNSLGINNRSGEIEEAARITTTVIDYEKSQDYTAALSKTGGDTPEVYIKKYILNAEGYDNSVGESEAPFILESRGLDLEGAELTVEMIQSKLILDNESDYTNPVTATATTSDGVIFGEGGLLSENPILGRVTLKYVSKKDNSEKIEEYGQNFVLVPMENWN